MKKLMLLTAILVIAYLSSSPALAASRPYESRAAVIMQVMYHQLFGFTSFGAVEFTGLFIDDTDQNTLQGDADHLGGGKTGDMLGDGDKTVSAGMETDALNNIKFSTD